MKRALCAALLASAAAANEDGGGAPTPVRITVRAIKVSNDESGMDPKLAAIAPHIQAYADQSKFRSFKLVEEHGFDLDWKSPAQVELPGSRSLQVTPRQLAADGKIKVHLEILGEHPAHSRRVHTDYSIQRGGTILIGGLDNGALLIAITQEVQK